MALLVKTIFFVVQQLNWSERQGGRRPIVMLMLFHLTPIIFLVSDVIGRLAKIVGFEPPSPKKEGRIGSEHHTSIDR